MNISLTTKDADKIIKYLREKLKNLQLLDMGYNLPSISSIVKDTYPGDNFEKDFNDLKEQTKNEIEDVQNYIYLLTAGSEK